MERINSVIPEASERDEFTVNDTNQMSLEFPIEPNKAKSKIIADKFLTDHEKTEIDEYE